MTTCPHLHQYWKSSHYERPMYLWWSPYGVGSASPALRRCKRLIEWFFVPIGETCVVRSPTNLLSRWKARLRPNPSRWISHFGDQVSFVSAANIGKTILEMGNVFFDCSFHSDGCQCTFLVYRCCPERYRYVVMDVFPGRLKQRILQADLEMFTVCHPWSHISVRISGPVHLEHPRGNSGRYPGS